MSGSQCSVCAHPAAPTLNAALSTHSVPVSQLARDHAISRDLLNYHRRAHLSPKPGLASPAAHRHSPASDLRLTVGPVSVRRERRNRARETFLKVYGQTGNLTTAATAARISRVTVYEWQEHEPEFALACQQASVQATEVLEQEAWRRAREGIAEPVFQHGKEVGTIQRYSDQLLMFLLRARAPERYRDRVDVSVTPVIKAVAGFDPADVL